MRGSSFAAKIVAGLIAFVLAVPPSMAAGGKLRSWQNLQQLHAGQEIEVTKTNGDSLRGTFVAVADQSISLRGQQEITVAQAEVSRVQLRPAGHRRHGGWIGAAIGAGAGAGVGAGIAERVATDFSNLRPVIIGVSAGVGALVGAAVGSVLGGRHTTIYTAK
jgi:head-tail adaptor